ncbi:MAG: PAS domain S-box protein [Bacteroidetes bacterium]|nr:PAS domain S-box protein [Bacteroidota bacterium]
MEFNNQILLKYAENLKKLPVAIIIFDEKQIHYFNDKAKHLLKLNKSIITKKQSIYDFLHPNIKRRIKQNNKKILEGKNFKPSEITIIDANKKEIFIECSTNVIYIKDVPFLQSAFTDITLQKQSTYQLNSVKNILDNISSNSNEVIFEVSFTPYIHLNYISKNVKKVLGYTQQQIYNNNTLLKKHISKEDFNKINLNKNAYLKAFKTNKNIELEYYFLHPNGKKLYVKSTRAPLYNNQNNLTGYVGKIIDYTKEKETKKLLEDSKQKFDLITKYGNDIIAFYTYLPTEKYLYVSPNIKKLLGYEADELLNDNTFFNKRVIDDRKGFINLDKDFKEYQKENKDVKYLHVFKTKKKNGEDIWIENNLSSVYDSNGKIQFFLNLYRDVTFQKNKEIEIENHNANLQHLIDLSPLAYCIHHNGICVYSNQALLRLLKLKSFKQINGKEVINFFPKRHKNKVENRIFEIYRGEKLNQSNRYILIRSDKQEVEVEMFSFVQEFENRTCIVSLIHNITELQEKDRERIKLELSQQHNKELQKEINEKEIIAQNLKEKTTHLSAIIENSNYAIWTLNTKHELTSFNQRFYNFMLYKYNFKCQLGKNIAFETKNNEIKNSYNKIWQPKFKEVLLGNKIEFESEDINPYTNEKIYAKVFLCPIIEHESVKQILCIASDISASKKYEQDLLNQKAKLIESSAQLTSIFENSNHFIWTVNKKLELTAFNQNYFQFLKHFLNIEIKVGANVFNLIKSDKLKEQYQYHWRSTYEAAFKGKKLDFESEIIDIKTRKKIFYRVFVNPVYNNNQVTHVSCIVNDITENKNFEKELINQKAKLSAVIESGTQLVWTVNNQYEITSYNENFRKNLSEDLRIKSMSKNATINVLDLNKTKSEAEFWNKKYQTVFKGFNEFFIYKSIENNSEVYREVNLQLIKLSNNQHEVSAIANDITQLIKNEQKLSNQAAKLNSIFDNSNHFIWTINKENVLTAFNKNYFNLIDTIYDTKPYVGSEVSRGILSENHNYNQTLEYNYNKAFSGTAVDFELELNDKHKNVLYLHVFLNPVIKGDIIEEVNGIAHDITAKKEDHFKLEQSIKEKEILLKEIHHRVKNNMQVISSILNLQSSYVDDPYVISLLKESQNRIKTMSYIHESLYQNKTFTSVNFSEYLNTLINNILRSYIINQDKIELELNIEKINLSLDNSIPTGLIVNELVTNAIKHAFPGNTKGKLIIGLQSKNNRVILKVKDTGMGFNSNINFYNSPSLGLQLVNTLADQLGAKIEFNSSPTAGTDIEINFSM